MVPVRADARTKIRGIVHGVSASGATVFVEPEEIIELNNRLKLAQRRSRKKNDGFWPSCRGSSKSHRPESCATQILAYLDLMDGAAKLASDLQANPVELVDASEQTEKPLG